MCRLFGFVWPPNQQLVVVSLPCYCRTTFLSTESKGLEMKLIVFWVVVFLALLHLCHAKYPCDDLVKPLKEGEVEEEVTITDEEKNKMAENFKPVNLTKECGIIPGKTEGDIVGEMKDYENRQINDKYLRSAIRGSWFLWPQGEVAYALSSRYKSYAKGQIAQGIRQFEKQTCLKFVPHARGQRNYVFIFPGDGCYSMVGRVRGRQELSLDDRCLDEGTVIHELMHSIGFFHEQSRHDRDDYITIHWDNIMPRGRSQFEKYSLNTILNQGIGYDYASIMHYSEYAFSRNGRRTITQKRSGPRIGQRDGFSKKDLQKIRKLYSCSDQGEERVTTTTARPVTDAPCQNKRSLCWILKYYYGICGDDREKWKCQKTCGLCDQTPGKPECRNKNGRCNSWAKAGYCKLKSKGGKASQTNLNYMTKYCAKACRLCDETQERVTTTTARPVTVTTTTARPTVITTTALPTVTTTTARPTVTTTTARPTVTTTTARPTVITTTARPVTDGSCQNKRSLCRILKYFYGICGDDTEKWDCQKTCGLCDQTPGKPECRNKNDGCNGWAKAGYCKLKSKGGKASQANLNYMRKYCAKSCKFC